MSKYQYLDSEGLKKYHNLSGYTSLPLDVKPGAVDIGDGQVVSGGDGDYITDLITLDPDKQYEIVINGGSNGAYIAIYDSGLAYVTHIADVQPSYKLTLSETTGEDGVTPTDGKSIRVCAHYATNQADTSELVILKSVHDNATNYVYDLVKENTSLINENTTLINENTSNIIRFHASHDITIEGSNPFEKGVSTTFTLSNLYLKLGDNYLTPETYSVNYQTNSQTKPVSGVESILNSSTGIIGIGEINDTVTFTYTLDYKGIVFSKSKTINAYYPMYFGSSEEEVITSEYLKKIISGESLSNGQFTKQKIKSTPAGSYSFAVTSGQYIYLLAPDDPRPDINRVTSGGFDIPIVKQDIDVQIPTGNYKVYRSASKVNGGTINIVIYT